MKTLVQKIVPGMLALLFVVSGFLSVPRAAEAQQGVTIFQDLSSVGIENLAQNKLAQEFSQVISAYTGSLETLFYQLNPTARNASTQAVQQMVADIVKQAATGNNGEPLFITNYDDYFQEAEDQQVGSALSGGAGNSFCRERDAFETKTVLLKNYNYRNSGAQQSLCTDEAAKDSAADTETYSLTRVFNIFTNCHNDPYCQTLSKDVETLNDVLNAQENADRIARDSRGWDPQKVCTTVSNADGETSQKCDLVTPASVYADSYGYAVGQVPLQTLLDTDQFNEVTSNFLTNLTNQAISSATGLLGMTDSKYNVFGPEGNLTYVDALIQDKPVSQTLNIANPITRALEAEQEYYDLQTGMIDTVLALEDKITTGAESGACYDSITTIFATSSATSTDQTKNKEIELANNISAAFDQALENLDISSTTLAILTIMDDEYTNASDAATQSAVLSTFLDYQKKGYFRTAQENRELELTYIQLEFQQYIDELENLIEISIDYCAAKNGTRTSTASSSTNSP